MAKYKTVQKKVKEVGLQTLCRVVVLKGGPQSSSISITWELQKNEVIGPHLRPPMLETLREEFQLLDFNKPSRGF